MVTRKIAVDTNIVIDFLRDVETIKNLFQIDDILFMPITVSGELIFGAINSGNTEKELAKYQNFIRKCYILNIDENVAECYAKARFGLKQKGKPIPENDIWIAATCIAHDIQLITKDFHFKYISDLKLIHIEQ